MPGERHSLVPRYGDDRWSLLSLTQNPSAAEGIICWTWFPDAYRETFRHATWALINRPLPDGSVAGHGMAMRDRLSAGRIFKTVKTWARFAAWLCQRGIGAQSAVSTDDLTAFAMSLITPGGLARNAACSYLIALSRLHYYSIVHLPAADRMTEPPWIREGHDDYLPAASSGGENLTEPLTPATMAPLLVWALHFVEQFAEDILAAYEERRRTDAAADAADAAPDAGDGNLLTYLRRARANNASIPATTGLGDERPWAADVFLAGITGTPGRRVRHVLQQPQWRDYLQHHATPALLDTPISTTLDGRPWRQPFSFYGRDTMVKELTIACFIVIAYLTGMRTSSPRPASRMLPPDTGRARRQPAADLRANTRRRRSGDQPAPARTGARPPVQERASRRIAA